MDRLLPLRSRPWPEASATPLPPRPHSPAATGPSPAADGRPWWRRIGPGRAAVPSPSLLLVAVVALPLAAMALSAWVAWRDAWTTATAEVEQASGAVAEFGLRVLSAHAIAAGRVDAMLRGLSDEDIRARERELHLELRRLIAEIPQAEASFVIDRHGAILLASGVYPVPREGTPAADRDYVLALRDADPNALHVSALHTGRVDRRLFFAVRRRRLQTGSGDLPPEAFDGVVNLAIHPELLAEGLGHIVPREGDLASLIRTDGELLARSAGLPGPIRVSDHFTAAVAALPDRTVYQGTARVDGVQRLWAVHRIEGWPVYAVAGRARAEIIGAWWQTVAGQLAVGLPATFALLALALALRRGQRRLTAANASLERRVLERTLALTESEARLNLALDAVRLGMTEFDLVRGTGTRAGRLVPGQPGLPLERFSPEAFARQALHPEDAGRYLEALAAAARGEVERYRITFRARNPDGEGWIWVEAHAAVLERDPVTGRGLRLVSAARDVTERHAAELALAASERRLQQALEAGRVYAFEVDLVAGETVRTANAAAILGLPEEQAIRGLNAVFMEAVHPDDRGRVLAASRSGPTPHRPDFTVRFRYRRPDGRVIWLQNEGVVHYGPDGARLRLSGLSRDVTAEAEAEAALRMSEERLRLALDAAGLGTWEVDLASGGTTRSGRFLEVNPTLPLSGFTVDDFLDRVLHPEDAPRLRAAVAEIRAGRSSGYQVEYRARSEETAGWSRILSHGSVVERDPATGAARRIAGVSRDVTAERATEEALAESERRLQEALDAGHVMAFEVDLLKGTIRRSANGAEILGLPPGQATHDTLDRFRVSVHPEDRATRSAALAAATPENPRYTARYRCFRADGTVVWLQNHGVVHFAADGRPLRLTGLARDVTAEAAREASEMRLRMAFEAADLGAWEIDLRTGRGARSGRWLPEGPVLPLSGCVVEEEIARRVHPEDAGPLRSAIAAVAAGTAEQLRIAFRARGPNGSGWRWVEDYGAVVARDPSTGVPLRLAGVSREVTEQRKVEAALADSERRLQDALEAGRVFAFAYDIPTDVVQRSANAAAILGLPPSEAARGKGSDFLAALDPAERDRVLTAIDWATPDDPAYACRYSYRRPDGRMAWLEERGAVQFGPDGKAVRLTSLSRDVTAEVEAERALREGEVRLRAAADGAGFGLYEIDFARGMAWFDARAVDVIGDMIPVATWCPLDGPEWAALDASIHPEDRAAFTAAWESVVSGSAEGWAVETRLRRPDGSWVWDLCHGTVVERDPVTGCPRRLVGISQDVTERHRLEEERRQGQKLQALGELAGGIAHDFNNVLQAVAGSAAKIRRNADQPEVVAQGVRMLTEATGRGAAITSRLLTFARRGELRMEPVDPPDLLHGVQEMLGPVLGSQIEVRVEAAANLPALLADRAQLETALVNLATNARDAMRGGGTLTFAAVAETVDARPPQRERSPHRLAPGRYLRLTVRDTGQGMDAATLARVTEPCFTTKPAGEGTGLGLPMVKGLAEQSGGAFALASAPDEGTAVTLWFPEAPARRIPAATLPGQTEAAAGPGARRRVLVVDDEPIVRETIADELEAEGHHVRAVGDAAEALALLDAGEAVDALVTDLTMPGLDGLGLIQAARLRRPGLPALLLTGQTQDVALRDGESGPFALLRKPATGSAIAERVRALLDPATAA